MNITSLRPKFTRCLEPLAGIFIKLGITPNMVTALSLITGIIAAYLFFNRMFPAGAIMLLLSAVLDLTDGSVARAEGKESRFGAVIDWIVDKYVDGIVIIAIGLSGIPIITGIMNLPPQYIPVADFAVAAFALFGSMINTFIKPVVYAEAGFQEREDGKINDPLEGIGFFGRPETIIILILGGLTGFIWASVIIVAACTNLSAIQRIIYLYQNLR